MKEDNFYEPNNRIITIHRCVALFYALFSNELNVQESDTTGAE